MAAKSKVGKVSSGKASNNKWNINIRVADNGYVVTVSRWDEKEQRSYENMFIASNEKELNKIVENYK